MPPRAFSQDCIVNDKARNILIVEDEPAHAHLMERALIEDNPGTRVTVATNLGEARSALESDAPDLVIADINLEDGKGIELLDGCTTAFPVLIVTAQTDESVAVEAINAGAVDYIFKSDAAFAAVPRIVTRVLREWRLITDRRHAQSEAADLGQILEDSVNELYVYDLATLQVISVNLGARRNLGYSRDEVLAMTPLEFKPDFDR